MIEAQIRHVLDASRYHTLSFRTHGSCPTDPTNQDSATTDFRIFAQSKDETALSPENFFRPCTDNIMQSYPGATFATDTRQALPKPYYEYFVTLIPQASDTHQAVIPHKGLTIPIPPPLDTEPFIHEQPSYDTTNPTDLGSFGPTTFAPLGYIVHARSGDKGSDANVGFFVRHADEWDWLRSILTVERIKTMLGRDYNGDKVFRFELPNIWGASTVPTSMPLLLCENVTDVIVIQLFTFCSRTISIVGCRARRAMTRWERMWPSICAASPSRYRIGSWREAGSEKRVVHSGMDIKTAPQTSLI